MRSLVGFAIAIFCAAGCVAPSPPTPAKWRFFEHPPEDTVFAPVIKLWQAESKLDLLTERVAGPDASPLAESTARFADDLRVATAEKVLAFVQLQSGLYYEADDSDVGVDTWPTLASVLERGADDCDGIDLLTFTLLRRSGFGPNEIYRTVLRRDEDQRHHMVTLWFAAGREGDPWVLDGTGFIATRLVPLSVLSAWRPVALFDETRHYEPVLDR